MSTDSTPRTITLPLDEWEDMIEYFRDVVDVLHTHGDEGEPEETWDAYAVKAVTEWADEIGRQL